MTRVIATHPPVELVEQRDDHTRVWEIVREVETTHPDGSTTVDTVNSYIHEKGSGLCYKDATGSYVPAVAEWRETPNGFLIDRCAYGLAIGKKIGAGMGYNVEGHELSLRPAYLMVSDGVNEAHLALLNPDAEGLIVEGKPSVVRFPAAFGPGYDLEYVAEKGGFHQNLIISERLGLARGLDAVRTRAYLYTSINAGDYISDPTCWARFGAEPIDLGAGGVLTPASDVDPIILGGLREAPDGTFCDGPILSFEVSPVYDSAAPRIPQVLAERQLIRDEASAELFLMESIPFRFLQESSLPVLWDYETVSGSIEGEETWETGVTYVVTGNVYVSGTLTIQAGAFVKLNKYTSISIQAGGGEILAQGTKTNYIRFTDAGDNDPDWGGQVPSPPGNPGRYNYAIQLGSTSSDDSVVQYCMFRNGGLAVWCLQKLNNAISHNVISEMDDAIGIWFYGLSDGGPCHNNLVSGCEVAGVALTYATVASITNNTMDDCEKGIHAWNSTCSSVKDNILSRNSIGINNEGSGSLGVDHNGYWDCETNISGQAMGEHSKELEDCPYAGYGQFFLDQYCALINGGSRLASAAGLSGHATSPGTNKDGGWTDASWVDIGYQYPHLSVKPYVQNVGTDRATLMWTATASGPGSVEWGPVGGERTETAAPGPEWVDPLYVYQVELSEPELQADTLYRYRVRHRGNYSHDNTFYTAKTSGNSFRFLVYGDNRGGTATPPQFQGNHFRVVNSILVHTWQGPRPRFVLHCGDFVHDGGTVGQWDPHFFDPASGLLGSTSLWPSLGNHEYNGDSDASNYKDLFSVPMVPKPGQEYWYSFDYGNCHFTVLDTKNTVWFQEDSPQHNWLKSDLNASSGATWKFVLLHVPPYTHSNAHEYDDGDVTAVREQLAEKVFNKSQYGVDAVFCGHNHFYEHSFKFYDESETDGVHYIVTGGGGADGNHNPWYQWDTQDPPNPARHCADPSSPLNYFHYLTVDVPGGAGKSVVKQWRHRDGQPPLLVETVTVGEPPTGW